jgi:succinyl-CoA:acetate CoA-transferase
MMPDSLNKRIRNRRLLAKVVPPEKAADLIKDGMTIAVASDIRVVSELLARRVREREDFSVTLWSGVVGLEVDDTLGKIGVIKRRVGQQTLLGKEINEGKVTYAELPLGRFFEYVRTGVLGDLDIAILEASAINEDGNIIPAYSVSDMPNYGEAAKKVIIKLNTLCPLEIEGIHDIYLPKNSGHREPIPINKASDRIGTTFIPIDTDKISCVVLSDRREILPSSAPIDGISKEIAKNLLDFLRKLVDGGRLSRNLAPIEVGLGRIPVAIISELYNSEFKNLEFYSAILGDGLLDLIDLGKVKVASGATLLLSAQGQERFLNSIEKYKKFIILRPVEITDSPEVVGRLGVISLNGAIEVDIYGHANITHIQGTQIVNGIGGVGEFAYKTYLSVVLLPSIARNGEISCIVPMVSHVDLTEHMVDVIVTEQGYVDLRGLAPIERAERIIQCCSHPLYRSLLWDYFERAKHYPGHHEPHLLEEAFSFHQRFSKTKTMKMGIKNEE